MRAYEAQNDIGHKIKVYKDNDGWCAWHQSDIRPYRIAHGYPTREALLKSKNLTIVGDWRS